MLLAAFAAAYLYGQSTDTRETVVSKSTDKIITLDGDSFRMGKREFRLEGIDAPEYQQTCGDKDGKPWNCGKASRASLDALLRHPGLECLSRTQDGYGRTLATCQTAQNADIGGAQVAAGMALSDKFNGVRSYGDEEDSAKTSALGIWQGEFTEPKEWRAANPRNTIKETIPKS